MTPRPASTAPRARRGFAVGLRAGVLVGLAAALLAACSSGSSSGTPGTVTANRVIAYAPVNALGASEADWPYFFNPDAALGLPGGTLDVVSLGYDPSRADQTGGTLTLGLGPTGDATGRSCAVDGSGDDVAVYENPFPTVDPASGLTGTDNEVAEVAFAESSAGPWYTYPHSIDLSLNAVLPARYQGFAGVTPTAQGGDRFDLAVLIAAEGLPADFRACYVRLTDGGTADPDYGNTQTDQWDSGADIDAVEALHAEDAPGLAP